MQFYSLSNGTAPSRLHALPADPYATPGGAYRLEPMHRAVRAPIRKPSQGPFFPVQGEFDSFIANPKNSANDIIFRDGNVVRLSEGTAVRIQGSSAFSRLPSYARARLAQLQAIESGWGEGHGQSMSRQSRAAFGLLLRRIRVQAFEFSLFLSRSGTLEVTFESGGQTIDAEFFADRIEFYDDLTGVEGMVPLNAGDIDQFASRLNLLGA